MPEKPTVGSLFSGIRTGGLDLGLERAGWSIAFQVENDAYCQRVLAKHWPNVPRYGDIREVDWYGVPRVDLLAGGFPCQPVSVAGKRRGQADDRWLWPEFARAIRVVRPRLVLLENVPGLLVRGLGVVLGDLAELGFDAEWSVLSACALGAPHTRARVFILAYSDGIGWGGSRDSCPDPPGPQHWQAAEGKSRWTDMERWLKSSLQNGDRGTSASRFCGVDDGVPTGLHGDRADRLRGLGNAVVPQVAEWLGRRLWEAV